MTLSTQFPISQMDRRRALKGAAGLGLALATAPFGAGIAAAAEKIVYLTPFGFLMGFAETMYADTGGFFAKHGLDVEIRGGRGSAMAVQQIAAGNVLVSRTGGTDMIKAVGKDPNVIAFAEVFQRDIFFVISAADKPLTEPQQFAGKTIGVVSVGGATENILNMMLAKEGIAADAVKRQPTGEGPGPFEFIGQGRIDAYIATYSTVAQLKADKRPFVAWSVDKVAPSPGQIYIASKKSVAERPEELANFLGGVYDALGVMTVAKELKPLIESMDGRYQIVERNKPDGGENILALTIDAYRPVYRDKLASNPAGWTSAYDLMVKAKIIEPMPDATFYTDAICKRAFG
jgi:ABC-type nitrate/sulfonate/bicarbonate transport system substrate-binding protein